MPEKPKCNHDESRLTCVDCGNVICSACLVQCPVGFRCRTCSGSQSKGKEGTTKAVNFLIVARSLITCGLFGYLFGMLEPFIDIPWVGVFLCLAAGFMAGRLGAPVVDDRRIGNGTVVTIVFGLLIGMSLTRMAVFLNLVLMAVVHAFTSQPDIIFSALYNFVGALFNPAAFIFGFLRSSVWRY